MEELLKILAAICWIIEICIGLCVSIILATFLWWGLETPWGTLNLDAFPPRITIVEPT